MTGREWFRQLRPADRAALGVFVVVALAAAWLLSPEESVYPSREIGRAGRYAVASLGSEPRAIVVDTATGDAWTTCGGWKANDEWCPMPPLPWSGYERDESKRIYEDFKAGRTPQREHRLMDSLDDALMRIR